MPQQIDYNYAGGQPATAPAPAAAPARPKTVDLAFWLLIASVAFLIIRIPVGLAILNSAGYAAALEANHEGTYFIVDVPGTIEMRTPSMIYPPLLMAAITLLSAIFIRKGHNWARILLAVFAALSLLVAVVMMLVEVPVMAAVLMSLAAAVLTLAATVLVFLTPSGAYFRLMGQYRRGKNLGQA
ncbi:hypothetical protein LOC60_12710 [Arthrobacter sp. zg-Y769]|nr:hypothetical protein [Arthrobacter sp. zg-Y769]